MAASWRRAVWFPKEDGAGQNQTTHPSLAIVGLILLNHYVQFSWIFWVLLTHESSLPINYETVFIVYTNKSSKLHPHELIKI